MKMEYMFTPKPDEEIQRIILNTFNNENPTTEHTIACVFKDIYDGRFIYKMKPNSNHGDWFEYNYTVIDDTGNEEQSPSLLSIYNEENNEKHEYIKCSHTVLWNLFCGELRNHYTEILQMSRDTDPINFKKAKMVRDKLATVSVHKRLVEILQPMLSSDKN